MFNRKNKLNLNPTMRPVRVPRSVQQIILIRRVFPDAVWQVGST